MARTLNQILASLPADRRQKIEARTAELALRAVRERRRKTQKDVADKIGVGQDAVSRMEHSGPEMRLSTLGRYMEGVGAKLEVLAVLPNNERVLIYESGSSSGRLAKRGAPRPAVKRLTSDKRSRVV